MIIKLAAIIPINVKTSYLLYLDKKIIAFFEDHHIWVGVGNVLVRPYDEVKLNCKQGDKGNVMHSSIFFHRSLWDLTATQRPIVLTIC